MQGFCLSNEIRHCSSRGKYICSMRLSCLLFFQQRAENKMKTLLFFKCLSTQILLLVHQFPCVGKIRFFLASAVCFHCAYTQGGLPPPHMRAWMVEQAILPLSSSFPSVVSRWHPWQCLLLLHTAIYLSYLVLLLLVISVE